MTKIPDYLLASVNILDRWLAYQRFLWEIPGLSVGVVYKNQTIFSNGYGFENIKTKKRATDKTLYRIASISKTFTATCIMQLKEKDKLNLDDKVQKYLPWFKSENDKDLDKITIGELLSHTAGILREGRLPFWIDDKFPTIDEIKQEIKEGISVFHPSEKFKYSNLGYSILGELIKAVSSKSYEQYVKENILNKLGLERTYADFDSSLSSQLATGYGRRVPDKEREIFENINTKSMASATGFVSDVLDLCEYVSAQFIGSGKLLSDESKKEMQKVSWKRPVKDDNNYGLGFIVGKETMGHSGGFQGYTTQISMDKKNEVGIVILSNAVNAPTRKFREGFFRLVNYFKKNGKYFQKKSKDLSKYEGLFTFRWGEADIVNINNNLICYAPEYINPTEDICKFEQNSKDNFKVIEGDDYGRLGENLKYEFDGKGNIRKVTFGANPMYPSNLEL